MRAPVISILVLCALALGPSAAQAATVRTVGGCDGARVDRGAGVARSLSGCGTADLARGAEGAARQALGRVSGALGVRKDTGDLGLMGVTSTSAGPRVRFQQFVDGVPVRNGQVAVALGEDGDVLHVGSGATPERKLAAEPSVSRAAAILTARRRVPSGFDTVSALTARLVAEPRAGRSLELAWHVVLPVRAPRGDWNVVVSARDGEVLTAYDALMHVDGSALTYAPNPVQQTGNTGLRDVADADTAALTAARQSTTLTDLNASTQLLRGSFVDTASNSVTGCDLPYTPGQASSPSRIYEYTRSQDAFEETVAYAAVTRVQRDFVRFGFNSVFPGPVAIDVHCISDDNSFFSTADDALHMGDGGVDDGEDADVVVHELGHATQHAQVPGYGPGSTTEQRAMGEGFGDFLATYTYMEDGDPAYQAARRFCVMEWDATAYDPVAPGNPGSGCLRWVDGTDGDGTDIGTYDGTPTQVHSDGRFWSAMLTCVFEGIEPALGTTQARERMLTLVLAHNYDLVPTSASGANGAFAASLASLRDEDNARFGGNEVALINQCGQQRLGITPPADSTPPAVNGTIAPAAPDGANGWYRTAPNITWSVVENESTAVLAGCQNGADPADTPGRTVTCTATSARRRHRQVDLLQEGRHAAVAGGGR